jgi:TonB-dependent receptor
MKDLKQQSPGLKFLLLLSLASATGAYPALHAEEPADGPAAVSPGAQGVGQIEGRVYFPDQDRFLESVRVTIDGTDKVASTDDTGGFQFSNVPAGDVKVTANFFGFESQTRTVTVVAGAITNADIELAATPKDASGDDIVRLEKFVVVGSRETLGSAIAEQEQRNAVNMKTVLSTDEFGDNPTGNIGDFLRHLTGVEADLDAGGEYRGVSLSGAASDYVPVQLSGFEFASAASEGISGRTVQMQQFSMNNLSRLEVSFSPTPESPGAALGGTVNMVPRRAFESKRAKFNFSTFLIMPEREFTLARTPGPMSEPAKKVKPSWNFSYTNPVSKNFGFTVSGGYNYSSNLEDVNSYTWRGIDNAYSSSASGAYQPPDVANPYSAPYFSQYSFTVASTITERVSASLTADWRLGRVDRLSFGFQYAYMNQISGGRARLFNINSKVDIDNTTTDHAEGNGYMRMTSTSRRKIVNTFMPTLRYMHIGSLWKIDAGAGVSRSELEYTDIPNGHFRSVIGERSTVKILIDKNDGETVPHNIETYVAGTDTPVDYRSVNEFVITRANGDAAQNYEEKRTFFANIRRDLMVFGVPVFLKAGVDVRQTLKDQKNQFVDYRYLGPDGIYAANGEVPNSLTTPAASDNDAAGFAEAVPNKNVSKLIGLGDFDFLNNTLVYNLYKGHPAYFREVIPSDRYTGSRHADETISAGYLRGDFSFFNNKLYVVGGVRLEQTHVTGVGPLRVPAADGLPARWIERGLTNTVTFNNYFPSVNAQYKFGAKEQWVLRASWFKSIGRPNYAVYNGSIYLPDPNSDPSLEDNYIQMTSGNAMLKPWTADSWRGELTYYFSRSGRLSLIGLTRDYTNRHVNTIYPITEEIRNHYGIGEEYMNFFVETRENSPHKFTLRELTIDYRQALTFLPDWARGFSLSAGATWRTKSGTESQKVGGQAFTPRSFKAGLSFNRRRLTARVDGTYKSRYVSGTYENAVAVEPGLREWRCAYRSVSANLEYRLTKRIAFWAQGENLLNEPQKYEVGGPSTPGGTKLRSIRYTGTRYTFGLKGRY